MFLVWATVCLLPANVAAATLGQLQIAPQNNPQEDGLEGQLAAAEAVFFSADQPDSIALFDVLIGQLQRLAGGGQADVARLLSRSFSYRAQANHNLGDEATALADLREMLAVDPSADVDRDLVSPKFTELFDAIRAETVGFLSVVVSPVDASLRVDGAVVDWTSGTVAVLAGSHGISVERLGFTTTFDEIEVEAGTTLPLEASLERTSAVASFTFSPTDAEVLLDGRAVVPVAGLPGALDSLEAHNRSLAGLTLGEHRIEIQRKGYRPQTRVFRVDELADYSLGALHLELAAGTIVLLNLPLEARVEVDGVDQTVERSSTGRVRLKMPPGAHAIEIDAGVRGVFSADVDVVDREDSPIDVKLRPSVAFLGVLGADEFGRTAFVSAAEQSLGAHSDWLWQDRREVVAAILADGGLDSIVLRDDSVARERIAAARADIGRTVTASAYVLAVLDDDLMAESVDLFIWTGAPGPAAVQRMSFGLEKAELVEKLNSLFGFDLAKRRPYVGAQFIDSAASRHPTVIAIAEGGPAATAALRVGDEIAAIDGTDLRTVADLERAVTASGAGPVKFRVLHGGVERTVSIALGASVEAILPGAADVPYPLVWVAAEAHPYLEETPAPQWLLQLDQAAVLLHMRQWEAAVRLLRTIDAPSGPGLGQGMVDYWVGLALLQLGPTYRNRARQSMERAISVAGATLGHDDGPLIRPLAKSLLAALGE